MFIPLLYGSVRSSVVCCWSSSSGQVLGSACPREHGGNIVQHWAIIFRDWNNIYELWFQLVYSWFPVSMQSPLFNAGRFIKSGLRVWLHFDEINLKILVK